MKLTVSPAAAREATSPAVGIFWRIGSALLIDRSPLTTAEPYGDCLTHDAGHYEKWEGWRALGARSLLSAGYPPEIAFTEYDAWPRGRTVYETERDCFVLYMDRRLQTDSVVQALLTAFGLSGASIQVRSDAHYQ